MVQKSKIKMVVNIFCCLKLWVWRKFNCQKTTQWA